MHGSKFAYLKTHEYLMAKLIPRVKCHHRQSSHFLFFGNYHAVYLFVVYCKSVYFDPIYSFFLLYWLDFHQILIELYNFFFLLPFHSTHLLCYHSTHYLNVTPSFRFLFGAITCVTFHLRIILIFVCCFFFLLMFSHFMISFTATFFSLVLIRFCFA